MRGRRTLVVLLALALGSVAGGAAYLYLQGVQTRAYHNAHLVEVYEVIQPIPRGTSGAIALQDGLISKTNVPLQFRPVTAVDDLATIRGDVAVADIPAGQIVVNGLFALPATIASTAAQTIPKGDVAITISVDQVHGVAGLIQAGDQVDILVNLVTGDKEASLYQNVPILAVGSDLVPPSATEAASTTPQGSAPSGATTNTTAPPAPVQAPSTSGLVTFAVPLAAATRIALAEGGGGGSIYLALVPPGNAPVSISSISAQNLIPATLTP